MMALLSMVTMSVLVMTPLMLCIRKFPLADIAEHHCTRAYLTVANGKERVERNEDITEHAVNELLVFCTEHLPHLLGTAHG